MRHALTVTGGVITSAGLVLAATFSVLAVLPLTALLQLGLIVAVGVLLDTFIIRTLLVPALSLDVGRRIWWPSTLARRNPAPARPGPRVIRTARVRAMPAVCDNLTAWPDIRARPSPRNSASNPTLACCSMAPRRDSTSASCRRGARVDRRPGTEPYPVIVCFCPDRARLEQPLAGAAPAHDTGRRAVDRVAEAGVRGGDRSRRGRRARTCADARPRRREGRRDRRVWSGLKNVIRKADR